MVDTSAVARSFVDDNQLLDLVRKGEEDALRQLLARHAPAVFRFAMKMCRNGEDAEDVAQETLLAAVRGAKDVRGASSFTTWLYAVARSFCMKMRRRHKDRPAPCSVEGASDVPSSSRLPDEDVGAREVATALDTALAGLDDKYREVIVLRDVEGLSAREVGEVLGISIEAVKSRLHRARADMRERLGALAPTVDPQRSSDQAPCATIATRFSKYLEGEIGPFECAAMQRHVDRCKSCNAVCEGLRRTVSLCRDAGTGALPDELQARVRRTLENALSAARADPAGKRRAAKS
jgi:RNA polymerase sigma-70 factor (ECF subfamily)